MLLEPNLADIQYFGTVWKSFVRAQKHRSINIWLRMVDFRSWSTAIGCQFGSTARKITIPNSILADNDRRILWRHLETFLTVIDHHNLGLHHSVSAYRH